MHHKNNWCSFTVCLKYDNEFIHVHNKQYRGKFHHCLQKRHIGPINLHFLIDIPENCDSVLWENFITTLCDKFNQNPQKYSRYGSQPN